MEAQVGGIAGIASLCIHHCMALVPNLGCPVPKLSRLGQLLWTTRWCQCAGHAIVVPIYVCLGSPGGHSWGGATLLDYNMAIVVLLESARCNIPWLEAYLKQ